MDFHEILMKGDLQTDNIKSKDGTLVIEINNSTGKTTLKTDLKIESGSPSNGYVLETDVNGNCSFTSRSVPVGKIILFEKDTAVTGYSLETGVNDAVMYVTKGSVAGGENGATFKSGGTWTLPYHNHTLSTESNHTHEIEAHTLTVAEIASHRHEMFAWEGSSYDGITLTTNNHVDRAHTTGGGGGGPHSYTMRSDIDYDGTIDMGKTSSTGGGGSHNHGNSGSGGSHTHATGITTMGSSWRPYGLNYTRQRKS